MMHLAFQNNCFAKQSPSLKLCRTGVILTAALGLVASATHFVHALPEGQSPWFRNAPKSSPVAVSVPPSGLRDGIYLYGHAKRPGKLKTEYLVFKVNRQQVTGAVFMPHSSFDCFQGTIKAQHLNVKVLASYEEQVFEHQVNLNAYYPMHKVSQNDSRILQSCLNDPDLAALK